MSCGFTAMRVAGLPQGTEQVVFGTWDFKWPSDRKELRVAFQRLPDSVGHGVDFRHLIEKVALYASRWDERRVPENPFTFRFLTDERYWLPPPVATRDNGQSPRSPGYVEYEVLVSLAPLPIPLSYDVKERVADDGRGVLWRTRHVERDPATHAPLEIRLPTAQLGRFALRTDYGVPTVYLGRPPRVSEPDPGKVIALSGLARNDVEIHKKDLFQGTPPGASPLPLPKLHETMNEYFGLGVPDNVSASQEFEAAIVHEFGHVLGIPHLHQSPLMSPKWKSAEQMAAILRAGIGLELDRSFIEHQISEHLPSSGSADEARRGGALFSDWPDVVSGENVDKNMDPVDSVMSHPFQGALLETPRVPLLKRFLEPGPLDRAFLRRMYERRR